MMRWLGRCLVVGLALLLGGFAWFAATLPAPLAGQLPPADGIAVLTGGPGRIEAGLALVQAGQGRVLLITGVHPNTTLPEILRLAEAGPGTEAGPITLGHWARSTRGNAIEVAAWARPRHLRTVRIVTAGYHMRRALLELRRVVGAPGAVAHPVASGRFADGTWWRDPASWRLVGIEYLKLLAAWAGLSYLAPMRETGTA
jgi:uncharacterized SAM-binding protein YcdF (DUF218 family)